MNLDKQAAIAYIAALSKKKMFHHFMIITEINIASFPIVVAMDL